MLELETLAKAAQALLQEAQRQLPASEANADGAVYWERHPDELAAVLRTLPDDMLEKFAEGRADDLDSKPVWDLLVGDSAPWYGHRFTVAACRAAVERWLDEVPSAKRLSAEWRSRVVDAGIQALSPRERYLVAETSGQPWVPPPLAALVEEAKGRAMDAMRTELVAIGATPTVELMTQVEAARRLGLSVQRVHQLVRQLDLGYPVTGGGRVLSELDLDAIRKRKRGRSGPAPKHSTPKP